MALYQLKSTVYRANVALNESGLVLHTFGNVSGIDREAGVVVIKPSGVAYDQLSADNMVCVSLASGEVTEGDLNPSSDTPTHLELYRAFRSCGGIVHTHSPAASACAQACVPVRCMGTTHADYFHGDVPVTRALTEEEVTGAYEANTGKVIVETFRSLDAERIPAVLVAHHGPFVWGRDPAEAVYHASILEQLAQMERDVRAMNPQAPRPPQYLVDRHYNRKHGPGAYYGQRG
jgi:L-ribulose-5-phosphate 4-epimerase